MQKITIDISDSVCTRNLRVVQGDDSSRFFEVDFYEDGSPLDVSKYNASVKFKGAKTDNKGWYSKLTNQAGTERSACKITGNKVVCELCAQAMEFPGLVWVNVVLMDNAEYLKANYVLHTQAIECFVEKCSVSDEDILANEYYKGILEDAFEEARDLIVGAVTATTSKAGLMSAADKKKLDGISDSADTVSFTRSLSSGTKIGTITINGTATDIYCSGGTSTSFSGASSSSAGSAGLVPAPSKGQQNAYLRGDGKWATISNATTSTAGFMSASDKTKLDSLKTGVKKYVLIGDSYTDPDYTGSDDYTCIDAFSQCGITFSQTYTTVGSGFYNATWNTALSNMTTDSAVTDVILISGFNDYNQLMSGTVTITSIYNNLVSFKTTLKTKFPNAKAHMYYCGNTFEGSTGLRNAKYEVYQYYLAAEDDTFEVVRGSWTCILSETDTSDKVHPNNSGLARMVTLIASSIKNGFKDIERHEYKALTATGAGWADSVDEFIGYQTIDGDRVTLAIGKYYTSHISVGDLGSDGMVNPIEIAEFSDLLVWGSSACTFSGACDVFLSFSDGTTVSTPCVVYLINNQLWIRHSYYSTSKTISGILLYNPVVLKDSAFGVTLTAHAPHWA